MHELGEAQPSLVSAKTPTTDYQMRPGAGRDGPSQRQEPLQGEVPFGITPEGDLVAVQDMPAGLACGCVCPGCGGALVARKGGVRTHHFAHHSAASSGTCNRETVEHAIAKKVVVRAVLAWLAGTGPVPKIVRRCREGHEDTVPLPIEVCGAETEYPWNGRYVDVMLLDDVGNAVFAVEVRVSHAVDTEKSNLFGHHQLPYVEVDGYGVYAQAESQDALVLHALEPLICNWCNEIKKAPHQTECERETIDFGIEEGEKLAIEVCWEGEGNGGILWSGDHGVFFLDNGSLAGHVYVGKRSRNAPWAGPIEDPTNKMLLHRVSEIMEQCGASPHIKYKYWWTISEDRRQALRGTLKREFGLSDLLEQVTPSRLEPFAISDLKRGGLR